MKIYIINLKTNSCKKRQWRTLSKKRIKPKPEEHEGMPQHQHCPPAKLPLYIVY
jgi:hypothetical protein